MPAVRGPRRRIPGGTDIKPRMPTTFPMSARLRALAPTGPTLGGFSICTEMFGNGPRIVTAYEAGPLTDPTGAASGSLWVSRGGSWSYPSMNLRSAKRGYDSSETTNDSIGFRVGFQYDNKAPVDLNHTAPLVVGGEPTGRHDYWHFYCNGCGFQSNP